MNELERLLIERSCERLVNQYAVLNDARDHAGLAALFAEDGVFARPTDPGNPISGRKAILAFFEGRAPTTTRHVVTNVVVEVESDDRARGVSYVTSFVGPVGSTEQPVPAVTTMLIGGFQDQFVLTDEGWRIARRIGSLALRG